MSMRPCETQGAARLPKARRSWRARMLPRACLAGGGPQAGTSRSPFVQLTFAVLGSPGLPQARCPCRTWLPQPGDAPSARHRHWHPEGRPTRRANAAAPTSSRQGCRALEYQHGVR
eukprot:scaffold61328_cov26-Tisochrysis_lutea.AAC.5